MHIHTYVSIFLFVHDIFFAFRSFYSVFGYSYITCVFGENWLRAIHAFVTVLLFYFICCFCFIFFPSFSVSFCCASANLKMLFRRSTLHTYNAATVVHRLFNSVACNVSTLYMLGAFCSVSLRHFHFYFYFLIRLFLTCYCCFYYYILV